MWYELNFNEIDIHFYPGRVKELYFCGAALLS
jgi:hypothetical protein